MNNEEIYYHSFKLFNIKNEIGTREFLYEDNT